MDKDLKMMPLKQKQVVDVIEKSEFSKSQFEFYPINNDRFKVTYLALPLFHFVINEYKKCSGVPGANGSNYYSSISNDWNGHLKALEIWLIFLRENIIVGDPWAENENLKEFFFENNFSSYEELLNPEEQAVFCKKLDLLIIHIQDIDVDITTIADDMEHLKQMSSKISKKDLMLLLLGSITGYILTGALPPVEANSVWKFIGQLFNIAKIFLLANGK